MKKIIQVFILFLCLIKIVHPINVEKELKKLGRVKTIDISETERLSEITIFFENFQKILTKIKIESELYLSRQLPTHIDKVKIYTSLQLEIFKLFDLTTSIEDPLIASEEFYNLCVETLQLYALLHNHAVIFRVERCQDNPRVKSVRNFYII
jgi:hypothetical protein